jgi:serine/threonine protein kinase
MQQLHDANLSHQHISPKTILLSPCLMHTQIAHIYPAIPFQTSHELSFQGVPGAHDSLYVSPEQRLRISKTIDFRSDIYALGAVLFLLLTGQPPMSDETGCTMLYFDPNLNIPAATKRILQKMTSRFPEDRYQSFTGILNDLNVLATTQPKLFFPGQHDTPEHLLDARHLFGREKEVALLHTLINTSNTTKVVALSGEAGVGKTTLIQNVLSQLYHLNRTYVYVQAQTTQTSPFPTLSKAISQLLSTVITKANASEWSKKIHHRLQSHTHIIARAFPELQPILFYEPMQQQPDTSSSDKLFYALTELFDLITHDMKRPVIIIDDAHWLSRSECDLLETLFQVANASELFVLSFRSSENLDAFTTVLRHQKTYQIKLKNLTTDQINEWVKVQFSPEQKELSALTNTLYTLSEGNPLDITTALRNLHRHQALFYQKGIRKWITKLNFTYTLTQN